MIELHFQLFNFRLAHDFSDIFQPIFMCLFTWSAITISTSMLLIQIDIVKKIDYFNEFKQLFCHLHYK